MTKAKDDRSCTFCGRTADRGVKVVNGPGEVGICSVCVDICNQVLKAESVPTPHNPRDRHSCTLQRDGALLVIVDAQERLLAEVVERDRVKRNVAKLVEAARVLDVPVVVTEQNPKVFGATVVAPPSPPIAKMAFSGFAVDEFRAALSKTGRSQLVICGLETHICVMQTALDAVERGYQVHVVNDACSSRAAEDHAVGSAKMRGANCVPASTESVIYELLGGAGTDEFRALLPLLKGK